jgi:hypothetical protein
MSPVLNALTTRRVGPTAGALIGLCVMATLVGGVAYAAIPDAGTGQFHGCVSKSTGMLRVIDPSKGQHCTTAAETPVTWNATGPRGPAGPASNAYQAHNDSIVTLSGSVDTTIVTLNLPAGIYSVFGRVEAANNGGGTALVDCTLSSGDLNAVTVASTPEVFALQDLLTLPSAGHIVLKCAAADGAAARGRITAISVASRQG